MKTRIVVLAVLVIGFLACKTDEPTPDRLPTYEEIISAATGIFPQTTDSFTIDLDTLAARQTVHLSGKINRNITLYNLGIRDWIIEGDLHVLENVTFTIQEGSTIYFKEDSKLVIEEGGRLGALGTLARPITFTNEGERNGAPATWGGMEIIGNGVGSSGTFEYLRIKHPESVHFNKVGGGTLMNHVQVYDANQDALIIEGGTLQAKYLFVNDGGMTAFKISDGFTGLGEYWVADQRVVGTDAITISNNNLDTLSSDPVTWPQLSHYTVVGSGMGQGITVHEGSGAWIANGLVTGYSTGVSVGSDVNTQIQDDIGHIRFWNNIVYNNGTNFDNWDVYADTDYVNKTTDPNVLSGILGVVDSSAVPLDMTGLDLSFFSTSKQVGGVAVMDTTHWLKGWAFKTNTTTY